MKTRTFNNKEFIDDKAGVYYDAKNNEIFTLTHKKYFSIYSSESKYIEVVPNFLKLVSENMSKNYHDFYLYKEELFRIGDL